MTAKQTLRECQAFSALNKAELEQIADLAVENEYEAGATIFQEGDTAEELFVLQEGKVAIQIPLSAAQAQIGRRITVEVITRNEVFGWPAVVEPYAYALTAVCLQKAKLLSISGTKLRALFQSNHHIGYEVLKGLIKVVASRLHETRQLLVSERSLFQKPE